MGLDTASVASLTVHAPAKLNLFLAITGRRPDGFHDLVSVVAPLAFGDTLTVTTEVGRPAGERRFTLRCTDAEVPTDGSNLVLRAAEAFAARTGWTGTADFQLEKRVPMGAGLGGGSSDGVAALRALNRLAGDPLDHAALVDVAAGLGSDCPLFLADGPVVMRGRGERVERLPEAAAAKMRGRAVLVFKPPFGISTVWAYRTLAAEAAADAAAGRAATVYLPEADAERRLRTWVDSAASLDALLFNNLERPAFRKHLALPTLLELLEHRHGLACRMSGSGSACFALLPDAAGEAEIATTIRNAWGSAAFVVKTHIA